MEHSTDFNDGRLFSISRQILLRGHTGRLTVVGNILPDQYTALRLCGFDDALILANSAYSRVDALNKAHALTSVEGSVTRNTIAQQEIGNDRNSQRNSNRRTPLVGYAVYDKDHA